MMPGPPAERPGAVAPGEDPYQVTRDYFDRMAPGGPGPPKTGPLNPPAIPADTTREAWEQQRNFIRGLTPAQRAERHYQFQMAMERALELAVRRAHPDYDDQQVFYCLVIRRYGEEYAHKMWPESREVDR